MGNSTTTAKPSRPKGLQLIELDLWKEESGNEVASFELHGSIGDWESDDEDEGGLREPTDLSLLRDLLERFQRTGGEPC